MTPIRIIPYGPSDSISLLCNSLRDRGANVKKIKLSGSTYRGSSDHFILNWGSHTAHNINRSFQIFNTPEAVAIASNKIKTFETLRDAGMGRNIPNWTTDIHVARVFSEAGAIVYCRTLTRSSQGRGIVVANTPDQLVAAPLYTQKCLRRREVRIHIFDGKMISFAQKKKMTQESLQEVGAEFSNDIRSHSNGWVFAREGVTIPEEAQEVAVRAVSALGLDFGAVDMALSLGNPKIFEINSAPGLEGITLQHYVEAIWNKVVNLER